MARQGEWRYPYDVSDADLLSAANVTCFINRGYRRTKRENRANVHAASGSISCIVRATTRRALWFRLEGPFCVSRGARTPEGLAAAPWRRSGDLPALSVSLPRSPPPASHLHSTSSPLRSVAPGLPSGINETTPLVPRLLLPLAALLAVAPAVAQTPASTSVKLSKDSVVPLVFDWPVGTVAHVEVLKEEVRARDGETTDSTVSAVTYEMRVEAHPDGLVVAHSDVEIGAIEGADAGANLAEPRMNELANATVGALLPDFVVNTDGALIALDDVESLIARYREFLLAAAEADGAVDPDVQARTDEFLAGFLSPQVLTMMTASEWNAHVGGWAGAEMEVGAVYEVPSEGSVPIVPGATIPMTTTYTLTERVPCMKGEAGAFTRHDRKVTTYTYGD